MWDKLASAGGVFDEIFESTKEELFEMLGDWLRKVLLNYGGKQIGVRQLFDIVEEQFNRGYLNEDADEPKATREAKFEMGKVFEGAMQVALPVLTEGMEKVQNVQDAQKVKTAAGK